MLKSGKTSAVRIGRLEYISSSAEIIDDNVRVVLPSLQAAVLDALVQADGGIVRREDLYSRLWPDTVVEYDQSLNTTVKELRRSLNDDARTPQFIETVPKRGYRLIVEVEHPAAAHRVIRPALWVTITATVLAAMLILTGRAQQPMQSPASPLHLAVLPGLTHDGNLLDGIMASFDDNLRREISRDSGAAIAVLGPAVSSTLANDAPPSPGSDVDLTVQVVMTTAAPLYAAQVVVLDHETELWSHEYEGIVIADEIDTALFADRIASDLVAALDNKNDAIPASLKSPSLSIDARRAILEAEYLLTKGKPQQARDLMEPIAQQTPHDEVLLIFGKAQHDLAILHGETFQDATNTLLRANAINPQNIDVALTLGDYAFYDEAKWHDALRWYRQAASKGSHRSDVHYKISWCFSSLGRHAEAIRHIEGALAFDPVSTQLLGDASWIYFYARQYDEAISLALRSLEYDKDNSSALTCLQLVYAKLGQYESAVLMASRFLSTLTPDTRVFEKAGLLEPDAQQAYTLYRQWLAEKITPDTPDAMKAAMYAQIGASDQACQLLEQALENRQYAGLISLAVDPRFDAVRDDPRFQNILSSLRSH
jgi:DNA-binding winged helix-turn-helix (wHTH) protein/tetratricopeptide (TPR) repeat protein